VRIARPPTGTEHQPRRRRAGHALLLVLALSRVLVAQDGPNAHTSLHDLTTAGPVAARNVPPVAAEPDAAAPPFLEDPELAARFQAEVDAAVERALDARLAGIPRPRYIPATDFLPPKGLVLHATKPGESDFPFVLAMNGFLQGRWLQLARGVTEWTDSAGNVLPVNNENEFNLNRVYLQWQGSIGHPQVLYNIALFGSTNAGLLVTVAPVGFVGWAVTKDVKVGIGVTQVPGTREWIMSSMWPMGVDRSMVNTFIRPSYSPGFMSNGALFGGTLFYQAGVYNGIDGGAAGIFRQGTAMAWAGNTWWEPLGPFGLGYSDMEHHETPAIRIGTSGVFAKSPARLIAAASRSRIPRTRSCASRTARRWPNREPSARTPAWIASTTTSPRSTPAGSTAAGPPSPSTRGGCSTTFGASGPSSARASSTMVATCSWAGASCRDPTRSTPAPAR
jgi:hypothetical protein